MQYTTYEEELKKQAQQQAAQPAAPVQQNSPSAAETQQYKPSVPNLGTTYRQQAYDPATDQAYLAAWNRLKEAESKSPTYAGTYDSQLNGLYEQITGRKPFSYDMGSDPLYRQYRSQYVDLGRQAMADTVGQAAGLTGGYGSTYGQSAGQQAYNAYLRQLNDKMPELYGMAKDSYESEGTRMLQQYGMLGDMRDTEYGRYTDDYNRWLTERNYAQNEVDKAYSQGVDRWNANYQVMQDNQNLLLTLMSSSGYNPTDEELAFAGLTRDQATAILNQYAAANTPRSYGTSAPAAQPTPARSTETEENAKLASGYREVLASAKAVSAKGATSKEIAAAVRQAVADGQINENQAQKILNTVNAKK